MSWLKICVVKIGGEGYNNNNNNDDDDDDNNNNNQVFFGLPQGIWENEFPVGNSFLLRGTEKKTQTPKVVWEKIDVKIVLPNQMAVRN